MDSYNSNGLSNSEVLYVYAIIENGGKQYKVAPGDVVKLEVSGGKVGSKVELDKLLFLHDDKNYFASSKIPSSAKVEGTILELGKDKKILVHKTKRRKQYKRTRGHRQQYVRVRIDAITAG
jgi:large subunit ribosomal protein L21